jgi:hypothetical protein
MDTDRTGQAGSASATVQPGPDGPAGWPGRAITAVLRVAGSGLLIAAAGIHLDLYLTGYRSVPVIGGLFLLQVIAGFGVGAVVLVTGSRVAAAAGAIFALATLGGYLLSVWTGLFGFTEVRTTAGITAGVIEVAAFAALAALAARPRPSGRRSRRQARPGPAAARLDIGTREAVAAIGGVSIVALVLLGVAVAGAGGPPGAGPPAGPATAKVLKTTTGLDPLLVRPGHPDHITLHRDLCAVLATADRQADGQPRRYGQAGHDHPAGRLGAGHLRRAPAVHLHRRHRPRSGPRQQHQSQRRPVARSNGPRPITVLQGGKWSLCCAPGRKWFAYCAGRGLPGQLMRPCGTCPTRLTSVRSRSGLVSTASPETFSSASWAAAHDCGRPGFHPGGSSRDVRRRRSDHGRAD